MAVRTLKAIVKRLAAPGRRLEMRVLRALQQFPAIGVPGAERVLLLTGRLPVLAVDSNGLRVLTRIGYAHKLKDYARTYRAVRAAM